jgi:hypothetical protein
VIFFVLTVRHAGARSIYDRVTRRQRKPSPTFNFADSLSGTRQGSQRSSMNENAVYVKTEAGEDAVTKRTIVQRNLRSVLIMIDGRTPVGNLAQQFGDPLIVEGLVGELEHRGLVRRVDGPEGESDADHSELSAIMVDIEDLISQPITPVADDIRRAHDRSSAKDSPLLDEFAMALPELAAPTPVAPAPVPPASAAEDDVRGAIRRAMIAGGNTAPSEPSTGPLGRLFDIFAGRISGADRKGPPGSVWKRLFVGAAALFLLLLAVFFLYPYSRHLPHMEQLATELLGQPVKITSVSPSFLPQPSLALEGLVVGNAGQLEIGAVKLIPRVSTLLSERTVMREVRIERAGLNVAFLPDLSRRQDINWASRWLKVERISVVDSSLIVLDGALSGLHGTLDINDDGALTRLALGTTDGAMKVQGSIDSGEWKVALTALGWQTPGNPSMLFDVLEASGTLNSQRLQFDKLDIKLYDGYAVGNLSLNWTRAGPRRRRNHHVPAEHRRPDQGIRADPSGDRGSLCSRSRSPEKAPRWPMFSAAARLAASWASSEARSNGSIWCRRCAFRDPMACAAAIRASMNWMRRSWPTRADSA